MKQIQGIIALFMLVTLTSVYSRIAPKFDKSIAFDYLVKQCEFGPRDPGSAGHQACLKFFISEFNKTANIVERQDFLFQIPQKNTTHLCTNIIAKYNPSEKQRILLCAHWDTRPWADLDPVISNRNKPIPGANDGASGVAVLLEIARHLKQSPPPIGIDIVLFDAEDAGLYGSDETWAIGSKEFAKSIAGRYFPQFGILLDMIGDKNLDIYIEKNSNRAAPNVVQKVWDTAAQLGISEFIPVEKFLVSDDHVRLLDVGIRCIDIIDFDYDVWHTMQDVPENCSPESLEKVGQVVLEVIYSGDYD
ncbi:M28 family peptidase [candidate division KSB1 bacterium]|nr:M28 family peptidase [candidate division KSB1 bacterium]